MLRVRDRRPEGGGRLLVPGGVDERLPEEQVGDRHYHSLVGTCSAKSGYSNGFQGLPQSGALVGEGEGFGVWLAACTCAAGTGRGPAWPQSRRFTPSHRFVERVIGSMFNTVSKKKIAIFGFAFKKDTGDTRETPAIDVCKGLIRDGGKCCIYDPEVSPDQIFRDMSTPKFEWDKPNYTKSASHFLDNVQVGAMLCWGWACWSYGLVGLR